MNESQIKPVYAHIVVVFYRMYHDWILTQGYKEMNFHVAYVVKQSLNMTGEVL